MKIAIVTAAALVCAAAPAAAQSVFDGTWKVDPATAEFGGKPISRTLQNGTYRCASCPVPWSVQADGAFHPVKGDPYMDAASVTVVDPATVKIAYRKDGTVTGEETATVSADGKMVSFDGTDRSAANGTPVTYRTQQTRVAAAPAGAHAISGSWRNASGGTVSDAGLTVTMKTQGDMLMMSYPTGESVTAKFGGPAAPVNGDPGKSMVKVARTGDASFTSTTMRNGKVASIAKVSVQPGGRTMTYASENKQTGTTSRFTATKQ